MAITTNKQHEHCKGAVAVLVKDEGCPHYAKLCCKKHNKMIQWLNKADYETIVQSFPETVGRDGIQQRSTRRRKPKDRKIIFQRKDGHLWTNIY